jgi:hypothetical protein
MSPIIWHNCRRADGSISLELAAKHTGCYFSDRAMEYLVTIEKIMLINSRQAAAIAIANALDLSTRPSTIGPDQ